MVVTTICIVGFPTDVLQRELRNLCRFIAGFEDANIVGKSGTLFVKFATVSHARAAINSLNGQAFDLDTPHTYMLKADFAKREMEVRHGNIPLAVNPNSGALSTITVLGVHSKGRTHDELHRWFQKFPGFSALQVNERIDAVFVKFHTQYDAERALHEANAQYLGAEWARRNMDDDVVNEGGGFQSWPRPSIQDERPAKRHKSGRDDIDTLAVMNAKAKGLGQQEALNFFSELPGFITMQVSERIDGIFIKFENPALAEQAMEEANQLNVGAEWARRNLEADDEAPTPRESKAPWQRNPEISTVTILGLTSKGLDREEVARWFQRQPNFQKLQVNDKIDAMFVKFTTRAHAEKAIRDAGDRGYGAELSRRNMDEDMPTDRDRDRDRGGGRRGDGDLDTIAILGVKGKGHSTESVQKWLSKRPGFIKCQANDRIDGIFAKFMTPDHAERAMEDANDKMSYGAEWARRNLET